MPKNSFFKATFILVFANLIVRIIGAVFKIPLARLIGSGGMGLYTTAYSVYAWFFILATAGVPVAISKMVSENYALCGGANSKQILKAALILMLIVGSIFSAALWIFSDKAANIMGNADAAHGLRAASLSIVFLSLTAAFRGFFQGMSDMTPTALSELCEAVFKLIVGYIGAKKLLYKGIAYAAAGALSGVCAGEIAGFILLLCIYLAKRSKIKSSALSPDILKIIIRMVKLSVPVTLGACVFSIANLADTATIMRRLCSCGFPYADALKMWGAYSGFAIPLFNLPTSLIGAVSISIIPVIAGAFASNPNSRRAKENALSALRLTILFALPFAAGLTFLSRPLLLLIYKNAEAANTLSLLGYSVIPVSVSMVSGSILQSTGHTIIPARNMFLGACVKVVANCFLVGIAPLNIMGAPVATGLCYTLIMLLNLKSVARVLNIEYKISDFLIRPLLAGGLTACVILYLYKALGDGAVATLCIIFITGICYFALLLISGAFKKDDLNMLPFRKLYIRKER